MEAKARAGVTDPCLVLFGDSISEGHPAKQLRGLPVVNMGISGDEADSPDGGLLRRIHLVSAVRPAEVFLLIGINDLNNGKSPATLMEQIRAVVSALRAELPATAIYLQSVLPTSAKYLPLLSKVVETNEMLRAYAVGLKMEFVDVFSAMTDETGALRGELTNDGVHLSEQGYIIWTNSIEGAPRVNRYADNGA